MERTTDSLCAIHTKRNCYINRRASFIASHRARSINNAHHRTILTIQVIRQISPILVNHCTINITHRAIATIIITINRLSYDLIRIQNRSIYTFGSILSKLLILLCDNVTTGKRILIDKTCTRRNLIELNLIPAVFRHQALNDVDTTTQFRQSLTILLMRQIQILADSSCNALSLCRRSILRRHPLTQQGRSLTLNIQTQLLLNQIQSTLINRSINSSINQIIPTSIFRDIIQISFCTSRIILAQPIEANTEELTLALATAAITLIKQTLHCQSSILFISILKQQNLIRGIALTISTAKCKHIIDCGIGSLMSQCPILSSSKIRCVRQSIHKSIHHISFISFFS